MWVRPAPSKKDSLEEGELLGVHIGETDRQYSRKVDVGSTNASLLAPRHNRFTSRRIKLVVVPRRDILGAYLGTVRASITVDH